MTVSQDDTILFIGGGEDNDSASPVIASVVFDGTMRLVKEFDFCMKGRSMIYCMTTFEQSNLLFTGLFGAVAAVWYINGNFEFAMVIDDCFSDEVSCLKYINN